MLAVYIGPIAQIVTRKAARESKNRTEFLRRVADSLGTQERAAFLHEVGRRRRADAHRLARASRRSC